MSVGVKPDDNKISVDVNAGSNMSLEMKAGNKVSVGVKAGSTEEVCWSES